MNELTKIVNVFGTIRYKLGDKLHRTDGPAIEYVNGDKSWWVDGKLHRTDGPAIERADGYKEWWVNDRIITIDNHQGFMNDYLDLVNQFLAHQVLNE